MISRRLWRTLQFPTEDHPYFLRLVPIDAAKTQPRWAFVGVWGMVLLVVTGVLFLTSYGGFFTFPLVVVMIILPLVISTVGGVLSGTICAIDVAGTLASEQETHRFDLLSVLPAGCLRLGLVICGTHLERKGSFRVFHQYYAAIVSYVGLFMGINVVTALTTSGSTDNVLWVAATVLLAVTLLLVTLATFIGTLMLDYIHSTLLGALIALHLAQRGRTPLEARLTALSVMLGGQAAMYIFAMFIGYLVYMNLALPTFPTIDLAQFTALLVSAAAYVGVREVCIALLWLRLPHSFDVSPVELDTLLRRDA